MQRGFSLNLMVVGEAGLGKSTLINSMFLSNVYSNVRRPEKTVMVEPHWVKLEEGGVKLDLTVVDTPGFGDFVDNSNCVQPIVAYIEKQFSQFLEAETRVQRGLVRLDSRVHLLLYFLPPTGHGLRTIDLEAMRRLHDKVNLIPVIGKSDAFTREELESFKLTVQEKLSEQKILVHQFPGQDQAPFAMIGSNTCLEIDEKRVWGRQYPWGTVNIEDPAHSDFSLLRSLILERFNQELRDKTDSVHYENFRCKELSSLAAIDEGKPTIPNKNPLAVIEDEKNVHSLKVQRMEEEMEEVFKKKVEEKTARMKQNEKEVDERMAKEWKSLEEVKLQVARNRENLRKEIEKWESTLETVSIKSGSGSRDGSLKKQGFGFNTISNFKFGKI